MPTYLLHVSGKTIGRESGLRDIPFATKESGAAMQLRAEEIMKLTVRRCLPHMPPTARLVVTWRGTMRGDVTVVPQRGAPSIAARFTVTVPSPADHQVGTTLPEGYR